MYCVKKITNDLFWVGVNDRRLSMFEGIYRVPHGVSYNSYILLDEKTVLFDTVDKAVHDRFIENVSEVLGDRELDYLVVQHMEPDHSSSIIDILKRYPEAKVVCNAKSFTMIKNFFGCDLTDRAIIVKEGDTLEIGRRKLQFIFAPMVHWPEVMVTYDLTDNVLFSADAFGSFGALNGAIFADEVNFERDYLDEARRYYTNIVGKYGKQVMMLLDKASKVDIKMICPLHGFVWRDSIDFIVSKHVRWATYEPEEQGVMIAYASIYGNTENAAEILASKLRDRGVMTEMFDVSVTHVSEILSSAFKWSHLVFASATYNAGIFTAMDALISDLVAHNLQNRTVSIIENGSWASTSGKQIAEKFGQCKGMNILGNIISITSGVSNTNLKELETLADKISADLA